MNSKPENEYLCCRMGGIGVGIPSSAIREVFATEHVTRIPGCPDFILGMINYRGILAPVLDLFRIRKDRKASARVVLLETEKGNLGLLADGIVDLVVFDSIQPAESQPQQMAEWAGCFPRLGVHKGAFFLMNPSRIVECSMQFSSPSQGS